jgi:hypothetical protein
VRLNKDQMAILERNILRGLYGLINSDLPYDELQRKGNRWFDQALLLFSTKWRTCIVALSKVDTSAIA